MAPKTKNTSQKDGHELIRDWQNKNKSWHFEGDSGLAKFEEFLKALGYAGHQFKYGDPIQAFMSDNPGVIEVMLEWIGEQMDDNGGEWRTRLAGQRELSEDEIIDLKAAGEDWLADHPNATTSEKQGVCRDLAVGVLEGEIEDDEDGNALLDVAVDYVFEGMNE